MRSSAARGSTAVAREPVWPATVALLIMWLMGLALPNRYILGPRWLGLGSGIALIVLFALSAVADWLRMPRRVQRAVILTGVLFITLVDILSLAKLIELLIFHTREINGLRLLSSSVMVWTGNVVAFALLYWLIDGRGPDARRRSYLRADFQFPQPASADAIDPAWRPNFMDYVFLAFTTATAFSPTDTLPLTTRARVLMMIESTVSLLTIAIAAARAINILK
ncbi:MAG: hypothetical protein ACXWNK_03620 [Vulcanimicrobiaceae bacterium]